MSLVPHIGWWSDPIRPHRFLNLSPITLGLAAVAALDLALVSAAKAIYSDGGAVPVPLAVLLGIVVISLLCAIPLGLISLVRDLTAGKRLRRNAAAKQAMADAAAAQAKDALVERGLARDLSACYRKHHVTLVEQARHLLVKSPYGTLDTAALTAELGRFQQHVVRPELAAKGYPEDRIDQAFEARRETLIRDIVAEVRGAAPSVV